MPPSQGWATAAVTVGSPVWGHVADASSLYVVLVLSGGRFGADRQNKGVVAMAVIGLDPLIDEVLTRAS